VTRRVRLAWDGSAIAVCRIGMGIVGLLAPGHLQRAALLDGDDPRIRIWTRFWATRAIGLGVAISPPTNRHAVTSSGWASS
jgi:hypothetical protein